MRNRAFRDTEFREMKVCVDESVCSKEFEGCSLSTNLWTQSMSQAACVTWPKQSECSPTLSFHCAMNISVRRFIHYNDVIMSTMASQITSLTIVYSIVYSDADERKHQSSASLAFAWGIHRRPVNSPHKGPVTRKVFLFDDVIMPIAVVSKLLLYIPTLCKYSVWNLKLSHNIIANSRKKIRDIINV